MGPRRRRPGDGTGAAARAARNSVDGDEAGGKEMPAGWSSRPCSLRRKGEEGVGGERRTKRSGRVIERKGERC